jgi:branched-chain amino acid transport system substrate-binding protein
MTKLTGGLDRRTFIQGTAAGTIALAAPSVLRAQDATIKIGYVGALSGIRGIFGETEQWTIDQMTARLAQGLTVGGKTYKVTLVIRDNQSDLNRSGSIAAELVMREGCNLVLAQDGDGASAIGELADTRGVPTISTMAPWEAWFFSRGGNPASPTGFPYTFHFFPGAADVQANMAQMIARIAPGAKVGTLYLDNPAGQGLAHPDIGLPAAFRAAGLTEVPTGFFQQQTNDFSSQIAQFIAAGVDAISGFMFPNHFIPFWNQAAQAGLKPRACAVAAAFLFASGVEAVGDSADGLAAEVFWTPSFPFTSSLTGQTAAALAAQWQAETGKQWTQPLGYGHALWEVGLGAIARAEDPRDKDSLRAAIAGLQLDTVVGPVNFAEGPVKSVAQTGLAGGQWRKLGGAFPFELKIVNNSTMPQIPVDMDIVPMGGA